MLVISLTTIPPRFNNIFKKLYDLYETQTFKPDLIILNICKEYKRFSEKINIDDDNIYLKNLREGNKIIINLIDNDYGALSKLYPTVLYLNEYYPSQNIDIITIDDDCEYTNNMIELLIKHSITFDKKTALGFFGFNLGENNDVGYSFTPNNPNNHIRKLDVLGGSNGLYYNISFFKNMDKYKKYIESLDFNDYLCDDEVSCMYLKYNNIDCIMLDFYTFKNLDPESVAPYALHKIDVRNRQNKTLRKCVSILINI